MKKMACWGIGLALLFALGVVTTTSGGEDKDVSIKDVMKKVHSGKPPVCAKISKGEASKEEKELAVKMYEGLVKAKPPKGDADSWKEKTEALLAAAKACLADDKDGVDKYKKAVNCKACHEAHKGK